MASADPWYGYYVTALMSCGIGTSNRSAKPQYRSVLLVASADYLYRYYVTAPLSRGIGTSNKSAEPQYWFWQWLPLIRDTGTVQCAVCNSSTEPRYQYQQQICQASVSVLPVTPLIRGTGTVHCAADLLIWHPTYILFLTDSF